MSESKLKIVFLAARPNFLAASAAPVLVGSALGYATTGTFEWPVFILALFGIMVIQAGANMANDYFDHISGNDWINKNPTPFSGGSRFIQNGLLSPKATLLAALVAFSAGSIAGLIIVLITQSYLILAIGIIGVLGAFFYTAPPTKFGYRGVGEIVIAILFGLLPVYASYYLQTMKLDAIVLIPAIIVSILVFLVIFINEFPDLDADRAVKKRTLIVLLGIPTSIWIYRIALMVSYITAIVATAIYPKMLIAGPLYLLTFIIALRALKFTNKDALTTPGQFNANQLTILLHTTGSIALAAGFIIARIFLTT